MILTDKRLNPLNRWLDVVEAAKTLDYEPSSREQQERYRRLVEFDDSGGEQFGVLFVIDIMSTQFGRLWTQT